MKISDESDDNQCSVSTYGGAEYTRSNNPARPIEYELAANKSGLNLVDSTRIQTANESML